MSNFGKHVTLTCFKAYDIRGKLGSELNEDIAYRIGRAYVQHLNAKRVVVGGDVRLSSESLKQALANGLMDGGADVIDIGMVGTEEIYFAAFHLDVDGGIEVTASHNPMDYNGMKLVRQELGPLAAIPASRSYKLWPRPSISSRLAARCFDKTVYPCSLCGSFADLHRACRRRTAQACCQRG